MSTDTMDIEQDTTARQIGFVSNCTSGITAERTLAFAELVEQFRGTRPAIAKKDGPGWVPADISAGQRLGERVKSVSFLVFDVEAQCEPVKDEAGQALKDSHGDVIKRVVGKEPPGIDAMVKALQRHGWRGCLHTSYSHGGDIRPAGVDHPRYRLILDVDRAIEPGELKALGMRVASLLGIEDSFDSKCLEPARLYFFPRAPSAERAAMYRCEVVEGEAVPVNALLASMKPKAPVTESTGSAIARFNTDHDVSAILERNGYAPAGRNRWTYPESTSGDPGVRLLPDDGGAKRVYSSHGGDPLNDGHAHDAFDLVRLLEHGGDMRAALHSIGIAKPAASPDRQPVPAGEAGSSLWPEPTPLPDSLPTVQAFDLELLPQELRGWVQDIAHRMQCPVDYLAIGVVTALSSLIGARAVVAPKQRDDWTVTPNLWGLVVGRPGVMKSPALKEVTGPLAKLEAQARERWQSEHEEWELDQKVADLVSKEGEKQAAKLAGKDPSRARALLAKPEPVAEPTQRRYLINNTSMEKLADILTVNPWGTLVFADELHGFLRNMDRQGQEGARGFYLTGYDGNQGYSIDRIERGSSHIARVCISMLGGIQPSKLQSYVRDAVNGGDGDDGLLQRFGLAVWPDVKQEFRVVDQYPDVASKTRAQAVFERLEQLLPADDDHPQEWRFDAAAQVIFYEWWEPFETRLRGTDMHPAMVSHLSKWRKLVPALALIFALVDTPDNAGTIGVTELCRALDWTEYLTSHAQRIYSAATIPETDGAENLMSKIRAGKLTDGDGVLLESFTPRMAAIKHWTGLTTPEAVRAAAKLLVDYGWLEREATAISPPTGGRPRERYLIHPVLLPGGHHGRVA